ncbi:MAG: hypothetical protein N2378_16310 [Chloroflexaceae bacterium]|nr:hypothetical protein [Chloroflexaceae bacterium]
MPLPTPVKPGDLITAELLNQILAALRDHAERIGDLESESDATDARIDKVLGVMTRQDAFKGIVAEVGPRDFRRRPR